MSDYLDRLETELVRSGFHQRRRVPVAPVATGLAVVLVASVFIFRPFGDEHERVVTPAAAVDASVGPATVLDGTILLRVDAGEPLTFSLPTGSAAVTSGRLEPGAQRIELAVPPDATGSLEIPVTLTDDDGNARVFNQTVELTPSAPAFSVLGDDTIVRTPEIVGDVFGFEDPVVHQAFSDDDGEGWVIEHGRQVCALFYGRQIISGCLPAKPLDGGFVRDGKNVIALLPDGMTYEVRGSGELMQKGNLAVVLDLDGSLLPIQTNTAAPTDPPLETDFGVVNEANRVPLADVYPLIHVELGPGAAAFDVGRLSGGYQAKVVAGQDLVCLSVLGPADGGATPCWPIDDQLRRSGRQTVEHGIAVALVRDGATEATAVYPDGHEEPVDIVDNVIVAPRADRLTWVTPAG